MKERILQFIDYKGFSKSKFYRETGLSNGILDKKSGLTLDSIEKIYSKYPEINIEWLLTGKGEMLKTFAQNITQNGNTNVNNGHNVSGQGNIIKQTNDELMEIIREKDKQIAEKDKQIAMLIEKISI
jgi:hypothetical protein B2_07877